MFNSSALRTKDGAGTQEEGFLSNPVKNYDGGHLRLRSYVLLNWNNFYAKTVGFNFIIFQTKGRV